MKVSVRTESFLKQIDGTLVLGLFKGEKLPAWTKSLPDKIGSQIANIVDEEKFKGDWSKTVTLRGPVQSKLRIIIVVGLGDRSDWNEERARQAAGISRSSLGSSQQKKIAMTIFGADNESETAKAQVEGFILSGYEFNKYKTSKESDNNSVQISSLDLIKLKGSVANSLKRAVKTGKIFAESAMFARNLQIEPGSTATPTFLALQARNIARKSSRIKVTVFDRAKIKKLKMGAIVGVSQGSQEPPRFIILEYKGASPKRKPIALVGKGITFDSGGISIKPSASMEEMKYDMSGAAAVLGVFHGLISLDIKENVIGVIPATENLPSGTALKPGDIVKTYSGKTIEIINTDAEGRLVLADSLAYAVKNFNPSTIIDLATLTGSVVVALSSHASAIIANNAELTKKLIRSGESTGERIWELPLWDEYRDQIKSDIADMKNIGSKGGGAITAAALLEKFVGDVPWAHLDIAGTAYISKSLPYSPKGPTGVGVRLLLDFLS